ncbi:MAG: hypothetical protein KY459_16460 [Acidobacteria bacterium]|nr:hypothetical protein [Acidobacteriota bacterium]
MRKFILILLAIVAGGHSSAAESDLRREGAVVAAAGVVSDYLDRGPAAISERLSESSPLRERADIEQWIELVLGPARDSTWVLETADETTEVAFWVTYGSGIDELVTFSMVEAGGQWLVDDVTNTTFSASADPVVSESVPVADSEGPIRTSWIPPAAGLIGLMVVGLSFRMKKAKWIAIAAGLLIIGGAAALFAVSQKRSDRAAEVVAASEATLDELLRYRRALAAGNEEMSVPAGRPAALWGAQVALLRMDETKANELLGSIDSSESDLRAALLEGRAAAAMDDPVGAMLAYDRALRIRPRSDSVRMEVARTALIFGFDDRARASLLELERLGTDHPAPHYFLAILGEVDSDNDVEAAEARFLTGMRLEPSSRQTLLSFPYFSHMFRRPKVALEVRLPSVNEPVRNFVGPAKSPIAMPTGWRATRSGEALLLDGPDDATVQLWGMAPHAPEGTVVVDALTWEQMERNRVLSAIDQLRETAASPAGWLQPAQRDRLATAVEALDERNRWNDVDLLTRTLPEDLERVPTQVVIARSNALQRLDRSSEATSFTATAAISELRRPSPDPRRLYELGEMMGELGRYDIAIRLLERADVLRDDVDLGDRIRQLSLLSRLEESYQVHRTPHFEIRYPPDAVETRAQKVGDILEKELARVSAKLGVEPFEHCTVNLLKWSEFRSLFTHSVPILGFYDGEITLPLAEVPIFPPEIVGLMTHELTHAIVADATGDKAPRWFQEGMAQRMEMGPAGNAFNRYDDDGMLAISLLDPAIGGSGDPQMIRQGYVISQTLVRYLESLDRRTWKRMLDAFGEGMSTSEALESIYGKPEAELDSDFREWGRAKSRLFLDDEMVRYDQADISDWIRFSEE